MVKQQRGGTIIGLIIGVVIGLGIALGVAVYVTKVPVPFINKGEHRDVEKGERERNQSWDPNSPLYGGPSARPQQPAASEVQPDTAVAQPPVDTAVKPPAASADPLGDLASAQVKAADARAAEAKVAAAASDGFSYFVQAGAFRTQNDADAQRAKLAMLGWEARITEREQNGRPVFRVRVGPFAKRGDAEQLKKQLDGAGIDSALVRVQQ